MLGRIHEHLLLDVLALLGCLGLQRLVVTCKRVNSVPFDLFVDYLFKVLILFCVEQVKFVAFDYFERQLGGSVNHRRDFEKATCLQSPLHPVRCLRHLFGERLFEGQQLLQVSLDKVFL